MTEFKFRGKTYKVVADDEQDTRTCRRCVFENDLDHRCTRETDMEYLDGTPVGSCLDGGHHYVEVKDSV